MHKNCSVYGEENIKSEYRRLLEDTGLVPVIDGAMTAADLDPLLDEIRQSAILEGASEAEADQYIESLRATVSPPPHLVIDSLAREVIEALERRGERLPAPVYAGEYPTGTVNACITSTPSGYLILVNTGLMSALFQAVKVFALAQNFAKDDGDGEPVPGSRFGQPGLPWQQTSRALAEIAYAYFVGRDVSTAPRYSALAGLRLWLLDNYVTCAERFIIAHELGHLATGHLSEDQRHIWRTTKGNLSVVSERHESEFEADAFALDLTLPLGETSRDQLRARLAGPVFYFHLADLLRTIGVEVFNYPDPSVSTHPRNIERARRLIEHFAFRINDDLANNARCVEHWFSSFTDAVVKDVRTMVDG
jgi:hypothetical protein